MKLLDIVTGPWAIEPDKLGEIMSIYDAHLKREKIDLSAVEARMGESLGRKEQGYDVVDGVAIIPVDGVIAKKANMLMRVSGACSTELIARDFEEALEDPAVESILFDIESPGGAVNGTQELARVIFDARGTKPVVAFANGLMASAAYWIGAAADEIYTTETSSVGSIGVVAQHVDVSEADKMEGVKRTEIYAGKYKRIASENEPLSEEGRNDIQSKVDYLYSVFVKDIADFRGASTKKVIKNMADGRVFIGEQAVEAGLVDGVSTFDAVLSRMASGDLSEKKERKENAMSEKSTEKVEMTRETLAESHPELVEAIRKEGFDAGVEAETSRVKAVFGNSLAGHEALVKELAFDGKTTGEQAAVAVLKAEQDKGNEAMKAMQADADDIEVSASSGEEPVSKDFNALVEEKMSAEGISLAKATMAVARENPEAHSKYLKSMEA